MNNMYDILNRLNMLTESRAVAEKIEPKIKTDPAEKGKYKGKNIGDLKAMKKTNLEKTEKYRERGEKVPDELKSKTAELDFAIRAKQSHGGKWGKIKEARNPQALDYQQGPEDDEEYRRHHGLDDPDRQRERRLRATDHKTLDRLERQAVDRAKQMDEEDIDEVSRGEYIKQQDTKAERSGKDKFKAFGQTFDTDEVEEGKHDPHPLDDPLTRFRKKHAPSVMRDPKGREEVSKLDVEYGERKKTGYGRGEEEDEDEEDGKKKAKPAGEKRGRGRPKGSKRAIGAKGPTGRSKLLTRKEGVEEDYDRDEYDEEGEMAKTDARTIEDAAEELQSILDDQENLPEWVQKKISLAKDYVDRARDYMKANRPEGEEMSLPEAADGEFTQADWNRIVGLKRMLMRMNPKLEPEDAEQKAAEKLGYDYEDVLTWIESDKNLEEKAVSKAQRRAAGIAHAAKKGDIPKSELRGASKEMAKMPGGELKKFAKTKEKGLPEKKTEEVEETTTAGNVAPAADTPKGGKKGGMQFGKGIYENQLQESFNIELEQILNEGTTITINSPDSGEPSVSVNATGGDAAGLGELLKLAGMFSSSGYSRIDGGDTCSACGGAGMHEAGCSGEVMEEDLANSANNTTTMDTDYMTQKLAGGLNGPKRQVNPNNLADNPLAMPDLGKAPSGQVNLGAVAEQVERDVENRLLDLYKRIA